MADADKLFHTVIQVEVLSQGPVPDPIDLKDVAWEIDEGEWSGSVRQVRYREVDGSEMARLLMAQGSSPEFLGLNADGSEVES